MKKLFIFKLHECLIARTRNVKTILNFPLEIAPDAPALARIKINAFGNIGRDVTVSEMVQEIEIK